MDEGKLNSRDLRDTLGCFATGVSVVTTATPDGHKMGLTVNSFSSLSLDPPLILWNLSRDSGLLSHFKKGCPFVVNFLHTGQENLALKFANAQEDRFKSIGYKEGIGGAPVFEDNEGHLECTVQAIHPGGDHVIIIGKVKSFAKGKGTPLLFHKGKFKTIEGG